MEQKVYQLDYPAGEDPLLILPLCAGAAVLQGEFFRWFSGLDGGVEEHLLVFMRLLYWGIVICAGGLAAWRLIRTIHATPRGLEYRFLGRTRRIIPWSDFACASKGRSYYYRGDLIYLIPKSGDAWTDDQWVQYQFATRNYWKLIHVHPTKNNIRAIGTYLTGL